MSKEQSCPLFSLCKPAKQESVFIQLEALHDMADLITPVKDRTDSVSTNSVKLKERILTNSISTKPLLSDGFDDREQGYTYTKQLEVEEQKDIEPQHLKSPKENLTKQISQRSRPSEATKIDIKKINKFDNLFTTKIERNLFTKKIKRKENLCLITKNNIKCESFYCILDFKINLSSINMIKVYCINGYLSTKINDIKRTKIKNDIKRLLKTIERQNSGVLYNCWIFPCQYLCKFIIILFIDIIILSLFIIFVVLTKKHLCILFGIGIIFLILVIYFFFIFYINKKMLEYRIDFLHAIHRYINNILIDKYPKFVFSLLYPIKYSNNDLWCIMRISVKSIDFDDYEPLIARLTKYKDKLKLCDTNDNIKQYMNFLMKQNCINDESESENNKDQENNDKDLLVNNDSLSSNQNVNM